jgi:hypothetical protein
VGAEETIRAVGEGVNLAREAIKFAIGLVGAQEAQALLTEEAVKEVNAEVDALEKAKFR